MTSANRLRCNHTNDSYFPPFIGDPIDDIFRKMWRRHDFGPNAPIQPCLYTEPDKDILQTRHEAFEEGERRDSMHCSRSVQPMDNIVMSSNCDFSFWIRIYKIPFQYYNRVYSYFANLGAIGNRRICDSQAICLRYLSPLDSHIALTYDERPISVGGHMVCVRIERVSSNDIIRMDRVVVNSLRNLYYRYNICDSLEEKNTNRDKLLDRLFLWIGRKMLSLFFIGSATEDVEYS